MTEQVFKADCHALLRALYPGAVSYRLSTTADSYRVSAQDSYGRELLSSSGRGPVWGSLRAFLLQEVVRVPSARHWGTLVGTPEGRLLDLSPRAS